jgi:hypothetical protein
MYIINYLNLKIKIPFLDMFEKEVNGSSIIIKLIKEIIPKIRVQEELSITVSNEYVVKLQSIQSGDYPYVAKQKHNFVTEVSKFGNLLSLIQQDIL